ncbi:hypothetical protein L2K20_29590 [Mycobacterium sp. MBM]|nr:hypothetical protein [Mycobacterium sp. MBM]
MAPNLSDALRLMDLKGPDRRWSKIGGRGHAADIPPPSPPAITTSAERQIFDVALEEAGQATGFQRAWQHSHTVASGAHWARVSALMRSAHNAGLGWLIPAHRDLILVPLPRMSVDEGTADVLHEDTGKLAVEWLDGSGYHFLRGVHFDTATYRKVVASQLSMAELCLLPNVDHRSIALSYLSFEDLVRRFGAQLIDSGRRGTSLFRLPLPRELRGARPAGYGDFDYFIHMRDASHPEREFIEWVDPRIGVQCDAELCQAHAFGISKQEWLSIEQAG